MPYTRNAILEAFKAVIDAMPAGTFGKPEARIGIWQKKDLGRRPRVDVWFHSDHGSHLDARNEQVIRVVTKLKIKHDDSDKAARGDTDLLQASAAYDDIHAAIETAIDSAGTPDTPFYGFGQLRIEQEPPGIQPYGFDDTDDYVGIGEVWTVKHKRARGAT